MKVFVISLNTAQQRRRNAQACLDAASIDFSFFDACTPSQALSQFTGADRALIRLNAGRDMSPAEIACFASHKAMWQLCVALGEDIIVLEDDVAPTTNWFAGLSALTVHLRTLGFVRLDPASKSRERLVLRYGGTRFIRLLRCPFGAHAYAITPAVAECFLAKSSLLTAPVDVFIKQFWRHGTPLYRQEPALVLHRSDSLQTTISGRTFLRRSIGQRLHRQVYKLVWATQRGWFNVRSKSVTQADELTHPPHRKAESALPRARDLPAP